MNHTIWARQALTELGWVNDAKIEFENDRILSITADSAPESHQVGILIPAPGNLHSHSFQRAMAGLTEGKGPDPTDSFWTWRRLMYRFLEQLDPDDIESIAAFVFMQMAEAGYAAVGEFHYLHHQANGKAYANIAEMSERIAAAASQTGIGLTLLPVLYQQGGCDGRELNEGQRRFGNSEDRFATLVAGAVKAMAPLPNDCKLGTAPHSVRAITLNGLKAAIDLSQDGPIHIHVAEQVGEVNEVEAFYKASPARWLMDSVDVNDNWCFIHGTQMKPDEIERFSKLGGVFGLCPITEASLGDGIFDARSLLKSNGRFGIGSDSNIRISLAEELRMLEFTQRLKHMERAFFATEQKSTGHVLIDSAVKGAARALGRNSGTIAVGKLADFLALDDHAIDLENISQDLALDSYIFAGNDHLITDVWSGGRHIVSDGNHVNHEAISERFRETMSAIAKVL